MTLWRISSYAVLDGSGGMRASGRWHTRGQRVAYCALNPATALLEVLVHLEIDIGETPLTFRFLEIEADDEIAVETADVQTLGPAWPSNVESTRNLGDEWLRSMRTALLRVPSVVVPATWNVLLNPRHPEAARIRVARIHEQGLDPRLKLSPRR